jgi:hypothetical protein
MNSSNTNKNSSNIKNSSNSKNNLNFEKCKEIMSKKQIIKMFSIKDIIIGASGTVFPFVILLIIVAGILVI